MSFSIQGADVEGGDPMSFAEITREHLGCWLMVTRPTGNVITTYTARVAFTRWGARRLARKWLRSLAAVHQSSMNRGENP